jgi:hypothetical protein
VGLLIAMAKSPRRNDVKFFSFSCTSIFVFLDHAFVANEEFKVVY